MPPAPAHQAHHHVDVPAHNMNTTQKTQRCSPQQQRLPQRLQPYLAPGVLVRPHDTLVAVLEVEVQVGPPLPLAVKQEQNKLPDHLQCVRVRHHHATWTRKRGSVPATLAA